MREVKRTSELDRVIALPRRDATGGPTLPDLTNLLTLALRKPWGTYSLKPIQAFALAELYDNDGLFGPIGVGSGKALISLLAPVVLDSVRPILFVPAALKAQTERQVIPEMGRHFKLHPNLRIESYNFLSSPKSTDFLEGYQPDLIILDEAHMLKRSDASRTKRFLRYMKDHPECKLVALSGTMTQNSLMDFWELCKLALPGLKCPLPLHYSVIKDWDQAIGAKASYSHDEPMDPGALQLLCQGAENPRQGFRRRLVETPGVVATSESSLGTSLVINAVTPVVPDIIRDHLTSLRKEQKTVWGEEVTSGIDLARHAAQLSAGFYYRWEWGVSGPDVEWLYARSCWHRELRHWLKRNIPGMDSPFLVASAIARGDIESESYLPWVAVRDRYHPHPPVSTTWVSNFLIDYASEWLTRHEKGIVWYTHSAIGARLAERGFPVFGAGNAASKALLNASGPIVCSIQAHGTGKNLAAWDSNLVLTPPSSGATWEQLSARTHRPRQEADEVTIDVCQHTTELKEAWSKAITTSKYLQDTTGQQQKLLIANRLGFAE